MVVQVRLWPEISFWGTFRLRSIGEFGFRFWNPDFEFCNRTRNPKTDFTSEKSVPKGGFQLRNSNPDFMDFPFTVQLGIRNRFAKLFSWTAVFFLLIMRAHARPLFLRAVFQILFRISQSNGKKENPKTNISALRYVFGFRVRLQIRNPDFKI